ncbi:MAG TPA: hypothetical protein VEK33_20200 [Terriglobales bacterium]|nr:hypothetical protein [Terriglobales bacterium]
MDFALGLGSVALLAHVSWWVLRRQNRRHLVAVVLVAVLVVSLAAPPLARAQGSVMAAIQAVLNVINGVIQTALHEINDVRAALNNFYQSVTWPVELIRQARIEVQQMMSQYRNLMASILRMNLESATLPIPQALETLIRDHRVDNFSGLAQAFGNAYRTIPLPTDASPEDRAVADIDDALTLDNLKLLKATDDATDLELQAADSIENAAAQAAPGSTPFLTAAAAASSIRSQALAQKMLAAELRQEAARMAHGNELRKHGATFTAQLRGVLVNLLQHN